MTNENENTNSNNGSSELTEEQKKAQAEQELADQKNAETATAEELREQNKKLFERAKSAEDEKRKFKAERDAALANANNKPIIKSTDGVSAEELRLIARGLSDEEIDKAKVIAKGLGISLPEALKNDMFMAYQNKVKEDERKEKAKLGASKGSGQAENGETFRQGMTDEEHKALWKKQNGMA